MKMCPGLCHSMENIHSNFLEHLREQVSPSCLNSELHLQVESKQSKKGTSYTSALSS